MTLSKQLARVIRLIVFLLNNYETEIGKSRINQEKRIVRMCLAGSLNVVCSLIQYLIYLKAQGYVLFVILIWNYYRCMKVLIKRTMKTPRKRRITSMMLMYVVFRIFHNRFSCIFKKGAFLIIAKRIENFVILICSYYLPCKVGRLWICHLVH